MSLNVTAPQKRDLRPRIVVFGVGGAGGNAVNNMIARELKGVDFVVANTDAQALAHSNCKEKIQLGEQLTEGLGAGADPEIGARAAEESLEQVAETLKGAHMCFITAGMGGGTGTGAAPVIAQMAREYGILTVGVVTKPFNFEGNRRMRLADEGLAELQKYVDTLIVIPNQNLFRIANETTTFVNAFIQADDVLYQGVQGVTDLMVRPGMINLDFADIRAVMNEMGKAMMGTGEAEGEDRALRAAEEAIANPLLDEVSLAGARGVLINITGGADLGLLEIDEAVEMIKKEVDPDANLIFGSSLDPDLNGRLRISVVATGIDAENMVQAAPRTTRKAAQSVAQTPQMVNEEIVEVDETAPEVAAQVADVQLQERAQDLDLFSHSAQHSQQASAAINQAISIQPVQLTSEHRAAEPSIPSSPPAQYDEETPAQPAQYQEPAMPTAQDYQTTAQAPAQNNVERLRARVAAEQAPVHAISGDPKMPERAQSNHVGALFGKIMGKSPEPKRQSPEPVLQRGAFSSQNTEENAEKPRVEVPAFLRRTAN